MPTIVLKFGGTSVGTPEAIAASAAISAKTAGSKRVVVVVSALAGVTDQLLQLIAHAKAQKPRLIADGLRQLEVRHQATLRHFTAADDFDRTWHDQFVRLLHRLRLILTGASLVGDLTDRTMAQVCSLGEQLSSRIMRQALQSLGAEAAVVDARRLVRTDSQFLEANVHFAPTRARFRRLVAPLIQNGTIAVMPGFFGQDSHGNITLLGRGGSDYSASIAAVSLDADRVEIWTDVDGIMSADPRLVRDGIRTWDTIELAVVAEMAHSGAKVLHPKTITAAVEQGIPVVVRNTFRPECKGTTIVPRGTSPGVRGIVLDRGQAVCHFTEPRMLDSFGFIHRCTDVFVRQGVPIDACATSEITFSCSLRQKDLSKRLLQELAKIAHVRAVEGLAKLCVIGHDVIGDARLLARIMNAIPDVPLHLVSLGASGTNVTLLMPEAVAVDALRALHCALFEHGSA